MAGIIIMVIIIMYNYNNQYNTYMNEQTKEKCRFNE